MTNMHMYTNTPIPVIICIVPPAARRGVLYTLTYTRKQCITHTSPTNQQRKFNKSII